MTSLFESSGMEGEDSHIRMLVSRACCGKVDASDPEGSASFWSGSLDLAFGAKISDDRHNAPARRQYTRQCWKVCKILVLHVLISPCGAMTIGSEIWHCLYLVASGHLLPFAHFCHSYVTRDCEITSRITSTYGAVTGVEEFQAWISRVLETRCVNKLRENDASLGQASRLLVSNIEHSWSNSMRRL